MYYYTGLAQKFKLVNLWELKVLKLQIVAKTTLTARIRYNEGTTTLVMVTTLAFGAAMILLFIQESVNIYKLTL